MKSLFETDTYNEVLKRIHSLDPRCHPVWGKMKVAQMLAHCSVGFGIPLSEKRHTKNLIGILIGWAFKPSLYSDKPWKRGAPTSPEFKISDNRDFDREKSLLLNKIEKFYASGPLGIGDKVHPFFGKLSSEQWGKMMYKHLDHHLRQFGG